MKTKLFFNSMRSRFLAMMMLLVGMVMSGQTSNTEYLSSGNGVWSVPCGVTSIIVEVWGAGGGGGRATENGQTTGGGGGGAYAKKIFSTVSTGDTFAYSVGAGGSADNSSKDGKDTWFSANNILMAKGGKGVTQNTTTGGAGGAAGDSYGDLGFVFSGGKGGDGTGKGNKEASGGGGGAANPNGNGGNGGNGTAGGFWDFSGYGGAGGASTSPGGAGGAGRGLGGVAESGISYGGGGGGSKSSATFGEDNNGGAGAGGYIRITYTVPSGTAQPIGNVTTINGVPNNLGCTTKQANINAVGGNTGSGVSTLWYKNEGICPSFAYVQEFMGSTYTTYHTTVDGLSGGNRRFISTGTDPQIVMTNVLSTAINPIVYKYITIRYRVLSGTAGVVQIFIKKTGKDLSEGASVIQPLISDNQWHILNIDMSLNTNWTNSDGNITGWRFDYASNSGVKMDIDYLILGNTPIMENTNDDDTQISITTNDTDATTNYGVVRIADQQAQCNNTIPVSGCTSTQLYRVDRELTTTGDWNTASNWSFNLVPENSSCVRIPANKHVDVDIPYAVARTLQVDNNGSITIKQNQTLTVTSSISNNNPGNGSNFIVADGANLIQTENGAINTGNIEVQKAFTFSSGRQQYNYVSSPTVGTNLKSIYTGTEDPGVSALYYIESNDRFGNSSGAYIAGRALALQEKTGSGTEGTSANPAKFRGVPFNGTLDYPLAFTNAAHGYNLVGNPYPSALSIEELYEANLSAVNPTFYFWDNRANAIFSQQGSLYGGDSYAKYNAVSGTGTGSGTGAGTPPNTTRVPNGFVSPAQGFLVQAKAAGQVLKFSNTKMRVSNASTNFFGRSGAGTTKDRYWLTLKAPSSIETMMAVVYFDRGQKAAGPEDSENSGSSDEIYSMVGVQGLSINGLPVFDNEDVVAVGYRAFAAGTHTISLFNREGAFNNGQSIYLKDKQLNTITDLTQGDYTFETQKGTFTNRFEIVYKPQTILATDQTKSSSVMVYRDATDFVVQSSDKKIDWVEVYDMSGRLYNTIKGGDKTVRFSAQEMTQGMYILKIVREGEVSSKRILK